MTGFFLRHYHGTTLLLLAVIPGCKASAWLADNDFTPINNGRN